MRRLLSTLLAGALVALVTFAQAQPLTNQAPSGSECMNAGQGPGGPSQWLCLNQVWNGSAAVTTSGSGSATFTVTNDMGTVMWTGTAPTTWAITLPCTPRNGARVIISTTTTLTTMVTITAATGCTMETAYSGQTITDNIAVEFQLIGTAWYRLR